VRVHAVRLDWEDEDGQIKIKEVDPKDCDLTSSDKPERCTIPTGEGGLYRATATIADDKGRQNLTEVAIWVAGGKLPPQRGVAVEDVRLVPDKKEYRAGDTAEVLVVQPFYPAEAILTLRRQGVFKIEASRPTSWPARATRGGPSSPATTRSTRPTSGDGWARRARSPAASATSR
jgi:hypothetical protein